MGHTGEYIASLIFDIALEESASRKGIDGRFTSGALIGRTVNIKWYTRQEGILDITLEGLPEYYLVLTGPKAGASSSRGQSRPWVIDHVYLFEATTLVDALRQSGVKIGTATSVRQELWSAAEIYPAQNNNVLVLTENKRSALAFFH